MLRELGSKALHTHTEFRKVLEIAQMHNVQVHVMYWHTVLVRFIYTSRIFLCGKPVKVTELRGSCACR